jgi:subtilisin
MRDGDCSARTRCPNTARQLVLFNAGAVHSAVAVLRKCAGVRLALSSEYHSSRHAPRLVVGEGLLLERLGAALIVSDPDRSAALRKLVRRGMLHMGSERSVRGGSLTGTAAAASPSSVGSCWGVEATGTLASRYSGRGVRVAILDTGLDFGHPDLTGRVMASHSFVPGLPADDDNGHGTFCAGVACGPQRPADAPRYGVAYGADLCVGRVLDGNADGTDGDVLAGIDWAVRHECAVVSLSLGSPVALGDSYPQLYECVAARALAAGTVVIAPAGNLSQRPDRIAPVDHPANCPSVVAVGAVDQDLAVAPFSNGGLNAEGGEVELVAPGIAILSAAPRPILYQLGSGTSMAVPFVAGVAALLAEADPGARGQALRALLSQTITALCAPRRDVGAGLVLAPL